MSRDSLDPVFKRVPALEQLDQIVTRFLASYSVTLIRVAVGLVFLWFGALKIVGYSPMADLVADTVYWLPQDFLVPFLGAWEIIVGLGLLFGVALRLTLFLFWIQMSGTFLLLIVRPDISFQSSNPMLLTTEGEFVVKNMVLIAAGMVIGSKVRNRQPKSQGTPENKGTPKHFGL